ncbi:heterokaryon incompatibility protein-domain-containing protein [Colletotrichum phormii]|uniref:Heterokaryon incompatibility protein-domain-containing protein n=1 Tax=Colletotrichum phormii TaxID=359342 RepID=A0AAJ0EAU1_9PEZI|nr:heterokaryon incompatibility protein-domain-containing protein [Colletotrichum phormii]KAK1624315.1 heterokaryon incompatibility protein-domain-containing protein [Colletotrichum phormii]
MSSLIEYSPTQAGETLGVEQLSPDLFKLSLTRANKFSIFSEAIGSLDSGRGEADLILSNLQAWSAEAAERFQRRTSDVILDTPFRLLCSSPTGIPFDSRFVIRQFLAISYSWHNPSWPGTPQSVPEPGGVWPVGKRFADAILEQRGHPREGMWIDQVCINQRDEFEQQRAIASMDVVYKSCRKLVVLLEDAELTNDEAELFDLYDGYRSPCALERDPTDDREISLLISLYDKVAAARWWQRSWCYHEFVVAEPWSDKRHQRVHNTVFILGLGEDRTVTVEWTTLHAILATITVQLGHQNERSIHLNPILSGFANRTSPQFDNPDRKVGEIRSSFMAKFNAIAQTGCLMPGDRLSVCLNLIGLGLAFFRSEEPTVDEVYYLAVLLALAAGEKMPLAFTNIEPLTFCGKGSWLARPVTAADTTLNKFTLGDIKGIHAVTFNKIEIDMVFFNRGVLWGSEEELQRTYAIFPDMIRNTPPPLKAQVKMPEFQPEENIDSPRRRFLAAVLSSGPDLLRRLWAQLDREVVKWNYNTGIFADFRVNESLRPGAEEMLKAFAKSDQGLVDIEDGITVEVATAFLTWITDPRSIYWISTLALRLPCTQEGKDALLTGFSFTKNFRQSDIDTRMRVAVPTDLLEDDCAWMRAWLLVPLDDEDMDSKGAWKVAGKTLLLGEPDLSANLRQMEDGGCSDSFMSLHARQVIVG